MFTRRVVACVFGLVALSTAVSAQTVTAGVKAGAVFASQLHPGEGLDRLSGTSTLFTGEKPGFLVGGFGTVAFTAHMAFEPEVLFVKKGVKLHATDNVTTVKVSVNYVEVPLLLRVAQATGATRTTGFLLVGPSLGFRGSRKAELESSIGASRTLDVSSVYKSTDVGLVIAGGVEIHREVIELRYTVGMSDIVDDAYPHADSIKNRTFALIAGFKF